MIVIFCFFLRFLRPPVSPRTATLVPYTTLFRSLVRPPAARPATRRRRAPGRGDDARVPWSRHRLGPMGACSVRGPILDAQILAGAKAARAAADHQLLLAARLCLAAVFLSSGAPQLLSWQAAIAEFETTGLPVSPLVGAAQVFSPLAGALAVAQGRR